MECKVTGALAPCTGHTWLENPDTAIGHYCSTEAVADPHVFYACYFFLSIFTVWLVDLPMESLGWRTEGNS